MGWWEQRVGSENLVIGDEPLDAIEQMLDAVLQAYENDLQRKPTPAEISAMLLDAFKGAQDWFFDDMAEREVSEVAVKLRKQPRRIRPAAGDYFAVPLPGGGYGYAQIVDIFSVTMLVGILDACSDALPRRVDLRTAKLIGKALTGTHDLQNREWPIVGHSDVPDYDPNRTREQVEADFHNYWISLGEGLHYRYFPKVVEQTLHEHGCLPR